MLAGDTEVFRLLWDVYNRDTELQKSCKNLFATDLNSSFAHDYKTAYQSLISSQTQAKIEIVTDEDFETFVAHIAEDLGKVQESAKIEWWHFDERYLTVKELVSKDRIYKDEITFSVSEQLAWRLADGTLRTTILKLSEQYIVDFIPNNEWVGSTDIWHPAFAACRALVLLRETAPAQYAALSHRNLGQVDSHTDLHHGICRRRGLGETHCGDTRCVPGGTSRVSDGASS
ncbi:MAG: hypothetical protein QM758_05460 [Armatimonas sp.]